MSEFESDDGIEVQCLIDADGPHPVEATLPKQVRGLTLAVKEYERLAIRAAVEKSADLARLSLCVNPLVGDWERATALIRALVGSDPVHLGYLA
jgi:6-phospho-beta-glucosidase